MKILAWNYANGSEGGIIEVEGKEIVDFDGASTLPVYILKELSRRGYTFGTAIYNGKELVYKDKEFCVFKEYGEYWIELIGMCVSVCDSLELAVKKVEELKKVKVYRKLVKRLK